MMIDIGYKYYRFGSADSIDIDILVDHPEATGQEKDKDLISALKKQFLQTADWNMNIISIENGVVIKSIPSKGSPDGVNNSLFETYRLHEQKFPFPLERKLKRNVDAAIEKCLTAIFTFYKNTRHQEIYEAIPRQIKKGQAPMEERLRVLQQFSFNNQPYDDDAKNKNAYKSTAFHIGQTISLINGREIYTKADLVYLHPELSPIIKRENIGLLERLNSKKDELIKTIRKRYDCN
ncbi:MAG: hypothetical protein IM572_11290 [Chitinophagaceae bacterium]|nr:hypothetical protein [Chitinophagaceae bacterium]